MTPNPDVIQSPLLLALRCKACGQTDRPVLVSPRPGSCHVAAAQCRQCRAHIRYLKRKVAAQLQAEQAREA
jgi:hypothetical protein